MRVVVVRRPARRFTLRGVAKHGTSSMSHRPELPGGIAPAVRRRHTQREEGSRRRLPAGRARGGLRLAEVRGEGREPVGRGQLQRLDPGPEQAGAGAAPVRAQSNRRSIGFQSY